MDQLVSSGSDLQDHFIQILRIFYVITIYVLSSQLLHVQQRLTPC